MSLSQFCGYVPLVIGLLASFGAACWVSGRWWQAARWNAVDAACDDTDAARWEQHMLQSEIRAAMARWHKENRNTIHSRGRDFFAVAGEINS